MTDFGTIKSYDTANGSGTITPEKGGDVLPFGKMDLHKDAQEPKQDERFGFDTKTGDNGKRHAVNLQAQPVVA